MEGPCVPAGTQQDTNGMMIQTKHQFWAARETSRRLPKLPPRRILNQQERQARAIAREAAIEVLG
jgi:hypothetical protein